MKKFLLSLAVSVTAAFGAFGQTVIKANQFNLTEPATVGGYTVELKKNDGQTAPAYNAKTDAIRLYAKGTLTVSGEKITKVVVALASDAGFRYTSFTPSVGALNPAQAAGDTEITWVGDAASVTFTVGEFATMGTDGETKAGQVRFSSITVYGEGGSVTPDPDPTPDPVETVGNGTEASPYTVADVIKLNNTVATGWVKGYIVGAMNTTGEYFMEVKAPFTVAANVFIADNATETELTKMVPVQLKSGSAMRKAVNLLDNPGNIGKELMVNGALQAYFKQPGVKEPTDYKLDGSGSVTPGPEPTPGAPTEGPGSENEPLSVQEAIAKNNDNSINWVNGIIVGTYDYVEGTGNVFDGTAPFTTGTNIVIATSATATDYFSVQLPAGKLRDLSLVERPALLGMEVSVCGKLIKYCGVNGMKETSDYALVGGLPEIPVEAETATLTTFIEEQPEDFTKILGNVSVTYQSPDKKYTFITDGESSIEVFAASGLANAYVNGDVLSGIAGKYSVYKQMPQMTPMTETFGAATKGAEVAPVEKSLDNVYIAEYAKVVGVDIVADGTGFNVTDGAVTRQLFDRFAIGGIKEAQGVTIIGIGAVYESKVQFFPIEIDYDSAISEIGAEQQGSAVIYDLQGRKVAKAGKGLYIVNGKKVLF